MQTQLLVDEPDWSPAHSFETNSAATNWPKQRKSITKISLTSNGWFSESLKFRLKSTAVDCPIVKLGRLGTELIDGNRQESTGIDWNRWGRVFMYLDESRCSI